MEVRDPVKVLETPAVDEQVSSKAEEATETIEPADQTETDHINHTTAQIEETGVDESAIAEVQQSIEEGSPVHASAINGDVSAELDEEQTRRQVSESTDANDDEVEIQVEPSQEDEQYEQTNLYNDEEDQNYGNRGNEESSEKQDNSKDTLDGNNANGYGMSNMGMGFNNMDMNPMAMMQQMMMNGINPMMGKSSLFCSSDSTNNIRYANGNECGLVWRAYRPEWKYERNEYGHDEFQSQSKYVWLEWPEQ